MRGWWHGALVGALSGGIVGLHAGSPSLAHAWEDEPLCAVRAPIAEPTVSERADLCLPPVARGPHAIAWTAPVTAEQARASLERAEDAMANNNPSAAVLELRVVKHAMPMLADRIALREAAALTAMGEHLAACQAYAVATESLDRDVAIEGRIGGVRCLLDGGDRKGEEALAALMARYPQLPEANALRLRLAQAREQWSMRVGAMTLYRQIDLTHPGSPEAEFARAALQRLRDSGVHTRPLTQAETVQRAEALVKSGPVDPAREFVAALAQQTQLPLDLRARVLALSAKLARLEGRWDEAQAAIDKAQRQGGEIPDAPKLAPPPAAAGDDATLREGQAALAAVVRSRPWTRLTTLQLRAAADIAGRYGIADAATAVLEELGRRPAIAPQAAFDIGMRLTGLVSDEHIAAWLGAIQTQGSLDAAIRYHHARALERLGRVDEARTQYALVAERDRSETHYYRLWSEQRLWALRSEASQACVPMHEPIASIAPNPYDVPVVDSEPLLAQLEPLVEAHGEAYPWLPRARDLIVLGLHADAADELHETYMAWRDAVGSPRLRAGLNAVLTGSAPPRRPTDHTLRRARLALDARSRLTLAQIAAQLGDPGIAYRLGGGDKQPRPRAYADQVERAAHRYGLDPSLLFAVMRVESIYNRRIVSTAGAVGLMQIMPRTGRLIADALGVQDFNATRLLEPELNVEFSAWYLASLLQRFDQRLPLAIAAYNGGPHNVRLWLRQNHPKMPLDAFLERIPFSQTHRYVRRVLSHMAAYRAQQQQPMTRLHTTLPENRPDPMMF